MPNRYRLPLKLLKLRGPGIPAVLNPLLAALPMVVEWPGGEREHIFSLIGLSAN